MVESEENAPDLISPHEKFSLPALINKAQQK
jgi:hypothetical protein